MKPSYDKIKETMDACEELGMSSIEARIITGKEFGLTAKEMDYMLQSPQRDEASRLEAKVAEAVAKVINGNMRRAQERYDNRFNKIWG